MSTAPKMEPCHCATTCCERLLLAIFAPGGRRFADVAYHGARWLCPECGKLWRKIAAPSPGGWEEVEHGAQV